MRARYIGVVHFGHSWPDRAGGSSVSDQNPSDTLLITWADKEAEILACLPVLRELRPKIGSKGDFLAGIRRMQQQHGYRLVAVWSANRVVACAGYSLAENLIRGRYLHVSDLVSTRSVRSKGVGRRLLQALIQEARNLDCEALLLECGLPNSRAHAFFFREGLSITALRFAIAFDRSADARSSLDTNG
jgi:GNAT superfamily N-acetyltransferase